MKHRRLEAIKEIIIENNVGSQDEILTLLNQRGFVLTQATLSRDLKFLKIAKVPSDQGGYIYTIPMVSRAANRDNEGISGINSEVTIEFSGLFAVLKTKPGYAGGIASDIDNGASNEIIGTIAGDDTILLIPREGITRSKIIETLGTIIPNLKIV
ncbi:MAG: arginine repressor [Bacteroidales bacterium]